MIEKMKAVCVATGENHKAELISALRNMGILHIAEKKPANQELAQRHQMIAKLMRDLKDYKLDDDGGSELTCEQFEEIYQSSISALSKLTVLKNKIAELTLEIERLKDWGEFDALELYALPEALNLHFYRLDKKAYKQICQDENVKFIRLACVQKMDTVAVFGKLPEGIVANEFVVPQKGPIELKKELDECESEQKACEEVLKNSARYLNFYAKELLKAEEAVEYSSVEETFKNDGSIVWICGYIPESCEETFTKTAKMQNWAWILNEIDDRDLGVPTKIRYNKLTALIKPIFDILGVVPGYREYDVSFWFLAFFALFFAMIIGDAGYGILFLAGTIIFNVKAKKVTNVTLLLYLLSGTTVVWGALTGTWFGAESAMNVPFLKALVIPSIANYPEYFDLDQSTVQNNVMKFCFSIGIIQLALACIMNIKRKFTEKNLSWVSDVGWLLSISALYFLVLNLVIGESINIAYAGIVIGIGFVLVVIFGAMEPGKSFKKGLKAGLGNAFTVFLDTISAFGNLMSYIRLFAVGMASLAIAQSFNGMSSGFSGPLLIAGVVIVIIGHALNIVMGFLSVVVHGVRLNLLEFSGQLGMEWSGILYEPFKKKIK